MSPMRGPIPLLACWLLLLAACAGAPPSRQAPQPAGVEAGDTLAARIAAHVGQARFEGAHWGVHVIALDSGRTLVAHGAGTRAIPASNTKLFTAALALDALGPEHRFTTTLEAAAPPDARGVVAGDLVLRGGGDPHLGRAGDDLHADAWREQLASALLRRGVRHVLGDLVADNTLYQGPLLGAGREVSDLLAAYAAPAPALGVGDNSFRLQLHADGRTEVPRGTGVQVTSLLQPGPGAPDELGLYRPPGSDRLYVHGRFPSGAGQRSFRLAVPDPTRMAGVLLRETLEAQGVRVDGQVRVHAWPLPPTPPGLVLAEYRSPPLSRIVRATLLDSDNPTAQHLFLHAGLAAQRRGACAELASPPRTTEAWGVCALGEFLAGAGIPAQEVLVEEGSGLSRRNLLTPRATTALLAHATRQPWASAYLDALPVAGVSGTLRNRLAGTPAAGRLRAKTGTLRYSYALAGLVDSADGQPLAFALMLDRHQPPQDAAGRDRPPSPQDDLDAVAALLAGARTR